VGGLLSRGAEGYATGMELRAWAESILGATTLDGKLWAPPAWTDHTPGAATRVDQPSRPPGLAFARERADLPGRLEDESARGRLLHRFANHELLALEAMAATLLAFPAAPRAFRAGIAATLVEEQLHLRLYLGRMAALGVELGELPLNDFFWRALKGMSSPLDYVMRMALVFEQANLDYALHFERLFREAGDGETAGVLRQVHDDEVGHVRFGLSWFHRWKDPSRTDWEVLSTALSPPLGLARARGPAFDVEGRRKAGLGEDFIERLSRHQASKGRPPAAWVFNPSVEDELARGKPGHVPTGAARSLAADLAPLLSFLAAPDDVVVMPRAPTESWSREMAAAGCPLPERVESLDELGGRKLGRLEPWGWGPGTTAEGSRLVREGRRYLPGLRVAADKVQHLLWKHDFSSMIHDAHVRCINGEVVTTAGEVRAALGRGWVVKAPFSTAGRGRARGVVSPPVEEWVEKQLALHGRLRAEPWVDRVLDLSFHYDVAAGRAHPRGVVRFDTNARGQFTGTRPSRWLEQEPAPVRRWLGGEGGDPRWLQRLVAAVGDFLGGRLAALGVEGPVGVDTLVYQHDDQLVVDPIVEVNPRWTMGRVSLAIGARVHPGSRAWWRFVPVRAGRPEAPGMEMLQGRMRHGRLFTTDPATAETVFTVLDVDPT